MKMVLVRGDGSVVKEGDELSTTDGEVWVVEQGVGRPPQHTSSTGRIWVKQESHDFSREFFPGVFGCKWEESESKPELDFTNFEAALDFQHMEDLQNSLDKQWEEDSDA
ncbi:MAG: hypothetical protein C0610_16700 [Desulfobacteraceae bacterium]|nr:MAG: hypothetical protein C0610_16700 [Desulfobacteraceae bacterium]